MSVLDGVFLCIDCSAVHRSLGVHLTFIRSTQLDTSWTWLQLRAMQTGGNAAATAFFRQHGCSTSDAQQKYNSRAANMYREKLHSAALKALKMHGTKFDWHHLEDKTGKKLHIGDTHHQSQSPVAKDVDFFKEHAEASLAHSPTIKEEYHYTNNTESANSTTNGSNPLPISNGNSNGNSEPVDPDAAPNVEAALSVSPTAAAAQMETRKPTIGQRKPMSAKKSGLGAKKGFGAQRVKANFQEVEAQAQQKDKEREQLAAHTAAREAQTKEDEAKKLASMRLAYQDLSVQTKKQDEKLKNMDPKKRQQMERLGMGFGGNRGVSHSIASDMQTIEQTNPTNNRADRYTDRYGRKDPEDDFEFLAGFTSGPPKYGDSPFGSSSRRDRDDRFDSWGSNTNSNNKSNWDRGLDRFENKHSAFSEDIPSRERDEEKGRSRKSFDSPSSDDASKRFGDAKAISSDMYFGPKDPDFEMKQNLMKFEGNNAISSADLFGDNNKSKSAGYYGNAGPDLQDIKEGVKQGVTKVAGRISSLANGVLNTIQDRYS